MNKEQFEVLAKELHYLHLENSEESSRKARITSHPIFYVQERKLVSSMEANGTSELLHPFEDAEIKTEYYDPNSVESFESLDDLKFSCDSLEEFNEIMKSVTEYKALYIYVDVCAHLTEEAANLYIEQNRHNLREPRTYVKSANRCYELIGLIGAIATGKIIWRESE